MYVDDVSVPDENKQSRTESVVKKPQTSLVEEKKKKKNLLAIIIPVILVIAITTVTAVMFSKHNKGGTKAPEKTFSPKELAEIREKTVVNGTISANYHTVGLKSDGTVVATGWNEYGQCDVTDWTNIVSIYAGIIHTIGLTSDGYLVATGCNDDGQCMTGGLPPIKTK